MFTLTLPARVELPGYEWPDVLTVIGIEAFLAYSTTSTTSFTEVGNATWSGRFNLTSMSLASCSMSPAFVSKAPSIVEDPTRFAQEVSSYSFSH